MIMKSKMKRTRKKTNFAKGFSLVEVLISLLIFLLGISAFSVLMTSNISNSQSAKDQTLAMSLAQEGIEIIRNIRDNNDSSDPFDRLVSDGSQEINNCRISYKDFATWSVAGCSNEFNNNSNYYSLYRSNNFYGSRDGGGTLTKYTRRISIAMQDGSGSLTSSKNDAFRLRVRATITWDGLYHDVDAGDCNVANSCIYVDSFLTK